MEKMSLDQHTELTKRHLKKIYADAQERKKRIDDRVGRERFQRQINENEPTWEDFESGKLSSVQKKFIHEQTVQNILQIIKNDEEGDREISWRRKKELLRNALHELNESLVIESTPEELDLWSKIIARIIEMEHFDDERQLAKVRKELIKNPALQQKLLGEMQHEEAESVVAKDPIETEWSDAYGKADRAFFDMFVNRKRKKTSLTDEEKRVWLGFVLRKLDVADSIRTDEEVDGMKQFVLRKLHELETAKPK